MYKYLYETLRDYANLGVYPFNMPGHKNNGDFFDSIFPTIDVTELDWSDDLYNADGVLLRSMERAARVFGAKRTIFLTGGSTAGILAAVISCAREGEKILVARNCHRSVYSGLIFSGAAPVYVYPEIHSCGAAGGIDVKQIAETVEKNPGIKAAILTSPTYDGFVSDIKKISAVLREKNIILIVDEAHGAHFKFHNEFPETALENGADIVVQSLHKTLPALGQSALLHAGAGLSDEICLKMMKTLATVQTSSPSYLIMGLIDRLAGFLETGELDFGGYVKRLLSLRERIKNANFQLIGRETINNFSVYDYDISKLMIIAGVGLSVSCAELSKILARDFKLQMEMSAEKYVLGMTSVADTDEGFERLAAAIEKIGRGGYFGSAGNKNDAVTERVNPKINGIKTNCDIKTELEIDSPRFDLKTEAILTPRRAMNSKTAVLPAADCIGEIAADFIVRTPPGVPILVPGERITSEILDYAARKNISEIAVVR